MLRFAITSKVGKTAPAQVVIGGSSLNQRLRRLIQQLGEAIHESVSESEHISEVVQDIRKQGFDVLLMLEATIGLNEVEQQPVSELEAPASPGTQGNETFNAQDVHFLRSLRISVKEELNAQKFRASHLLGYGRGYGMKDTLGVLLAGGAGERLFPLTRDRAKPAVPFGGNYRIIDITLSNCINSDLRRVYILTQYKALSLNRHIREGWTGIVAQELGEFIEILPPMQRVSANWYMGTADAVYQNIYSIGAEQPKHVLILSGDHIYKMNYGLMLDHHNDAGADVTLATLPIRPMRWRVSGWWK